MPYPKSTFADDYENKSSYKNKYVHKKTYYKKRYTPRESRTVEQPFFSGSAKPWIIQSIEDYAPTLYETAKWAWDTYRDSQSHGSFDYGTHGDRFTQSGYGYKPRIADDWYSYEPDIDD